MKKPRSSRALRWAHFIRVTLLHLVRKNGQRFWGPLNQILDPPLSVDSTKYDH